MSPFDSMPSMVASPMTNIKDEKTSSWVRYYSEDHECDYWYNEHTGESTWDSPEKVKQYPVGIDEEDYSHVVDYSVCEGSDVSSPTYYYESTKRSLSQVFDEENETTRKALHELTTKEDGNAPRLIRSVSTQSCCSMVSLSEETKSPTEVNWNILADRRKSRLLKKERAERIQRKRMRILLRILLCFILFIPVVAYFRRTNQINGNVNGTTNLKQNDEKMINDIGNSGVSCDSVCERTDYQIVKMIEEASRICIMKENNLNIEG